MSGDTVERDWLAVSETVDRMKEIFGKSYSLENLRKLAQRQAIRADKLPNDEWLIYWPSLMHYVEEKRGYGPRDTKSDEVE